MKRFFNEQKLWVYIGKVVQFDDNWLGLHAKGLAVLRGQTEPVQIDKQVRAMVLPRESIANIRVLPDDFDMDNIKVSYDLPRIAVEVKGAPDTWIGEIGEG